MNRPLALFWMVIIFASAYGLYQVKWRVKELRDQNLLTEAEIIKQKQAIEVLSAEWTYLTRPERLKKLAAEHLPQLQPADGTQMADLTEFPLTEPESLALVQDEEHTNSSSSLHYSSFQP